MRTLTAKTQSQGAMLEVFVSLLSVLPDPVISVVEVVRLGR